MVLWRPPFKTMSNRSFIRQQKRLNSMLEWAEIFNCSYMIIGSLTYNVYSPEEFEDTKGVIRIRISKKNRQNSGQTKRYKRTNNRLFEIFIILSNMQIMFYKILWQNQFSHTWVIPFQALIVSMTLHSIWLSLKKIENGIWQKRLCISLTGGKIMLITADAISDEL